MADQPFSERKTLTNQNKVTYSDKLQRFQKYDVNKRKRFQRQIKNIIKSNKDDIKKQRKLIKKVEKEITAPKPNEVKDAKKVLDQFLKDNNLEQAIRVLKRKLQKEGFFKIMKMKSTYEKPSERKKRVQTENLKRIKKLQKLKNRY